MSEDNEINSPQLEDGYTKIANELLDNLCKTRIRAEYRQMFDFIIRKTYGFHKKRDFISTKQIIEGTGLTRSSVYKARIWLKKHRFIGVSQKGDTSFLSYEVNKRYKEWWVSPKKETVSQRGDRVSPKEKQSVSLLGDTLLNKRNTKETIQKKDTFKKPSLDELNLFIRENKLKIDPGYFLDYYNSKGWIIGRTKMKDWKATARNWHRRSNTQPATKQPEYDCTPPPEISEKGRKEISDLVKNTTDNML